MIPSKKETGYKIYLPEPTNEIINIMNTHKEWGLVHKVKINQSELETFIKRLDEFQKKIVERHNISLTNDNKILCAFLALKLHKVDALILGHMYTSRDILVHTLLFYGKEKFVSTAFVAELNNEPTIWTDCALNNKIDDNVLTKIAINAVHFARYFKIDPQVALLSYATHKSVINSHTKMITNAVNNLRNKWWNNYLIDGPIQFDSAFNPKVYEKKTKQKINQAFNVFVFPDLTSANISYKIVNQIANIPFYGSFILGIDDIIVDLSRSATEQEILGTIKQVYEMLEVRFASY